MAKLKTLVLDIETLPILGYSWKVYDATVFKVLEPISIACVAYSFDNGPIECISVSDYKTAFSKNVRDDFRLVRDIIKVIEKADVVVAHNVKFDMGHIRGRAAVHGLTPPSPKLEFCTYRERKKLEMHEMYKLGYLQEKFKHTKKKPPPPGTWMKFMERDPMGVEAMIKYCKDDIVSTIELFEATRALSSMVMVTEDPGEPSEIFCTSCGSKDLSPNGHRYTRGGGKYRQWKCSECGKYSSERKMVGKSPLK